MKKLRLLIPVVAVLLIFSLSLKGGETPQEAIAAENVEAALPDSVNTIIQTSCYGCHSTDARGDKAKSKLNFDNLNELTTIRKISALHEIAKTVEEGEMPPGKFLERFPDKALSDAQKETLANWVKAESESLLKK